MKNEKIKIFIVIIIASAIAIGILYWLFSEESSPTAKVEGLQSNLPDPLLTSLKDDKIEIYKNEEVSNMDEYLTTLPVITDVAGSSTKGGTRTTPTTETNKLLANIEELTDAQKEDDDTPPITRSKNETTPSPKKKEVKTEKEIQEELLSQTLEVMSKMQQDQGSNPSQNYTRAEKANINNTYISSHQGFITVSSSESLSTIQQSSGIKVCINNTQSVKNNQKVFIRLLEPMTVGDKTISKNTLITGICNISGDRVNISINSINASGNFIPTKLKAYDIDGSVGLFSPQTTNTATKDLASDAIQASSSLLQPMLGAAARQVLSTTQKLSNNQSREVTVTLDGDYQFYLIQE